MKLGQWSLVGFLVLTGAAALEAAPFADGERVCFFGDSVTHHGYYTSQIQLYYYTRFPDRDIRIWNCGTGGATAGESMIAVDGDVIAKNPTHVVLLFGMNDCGMPYYLPSASKEMVASRPVLLKRFEEILPALYGKLRSGAPQATFTFCTLVPWDDALKFKGREDEAGPVGVTAAEVGFCDVVRECQRRFGGGFVDYYAPMLAWNVEHQKTNPYVSLSPDRIHPQEPGGLFMASVFLRAQQAPALVSDVVIDAASRKTVRSDNAEVSELSLNADCVRFRVLERSLPFAVIDEAKGLAAEIGFADEFNRERLSVRNLLAGEWVLKIDGKEVMTASDSDWAKGVGLSALATPMLTQAKAVREAVLARSAIERSLRNLWVDRNVLWRRLQRINLDAHKTLYAEKDVDDERIYRAFAKGYAEAYQGKDGDNAAFVRHAKGWASRERILTDLEKRHREIRKINRPVSHLYELVQVKRH